MSPNVKAAFDQFVRLANRAGLHPLDWGRFYDFVIVSHRLRSRLDEEELRDLLVQAGFDQGYAQRLSNIYHHTRHCFRRLQDPQAMYLAFTNPKLRAVMSHTEESL